jgi:hypothetical protein
VEFAILIMLLAGLLVLKVKSAPGIP